MYYFGIGYCDAGYYAGWDDKGNDSQEACNNICLSELQCTYAAWYPSETCSRYKGTTCNSVTNDQTHITFAKGKIEILTHKTCWQLFSIQILCLLSLYS